MWTRSLGCHCSPISRRWQPAMIGKSLEVSSYRFCTSKQMSQVRTPTSSKPRRGGYLRRRHI
ncbi:hypothetical protein T492DRAFT_1075703 [Pavlovales sp. CCMP2436]|nr:hypothetical protein T492DRAFT_1075703 [Pavlovales sp. CCMP2436]